MKKFGILFLMVGLFLTSCKKDKIEPGTAADVAGQSWTASSVDARENDGVLVVEAKDAEGKTIVIRTDGTQEGTYDLADNGNFCTYSADGHFYAIHPGADKPCGKVVIKKYDAGSHKCSGTFEFNAYDDEHHLVSCSNGHFGDVDVDISASHHPKCGLFLSEVDSNYCASDNISCVVENDHIKITGACGANGKLVTFKCPVHVGVGEHTIGPWGGGSVSCDYDGGTGFFGSFNANCGSFVVTKHDEEKHIIEGAFHMNLVSISPFSAGVSFQHGSFTTQY
ncbi:MAG TPA: hypothetical protein ENK85_05525 [Saprospiraceae bacterium]|nr:hypothetical protein [Saprospiraceae bacterium]